MTMMRTTMTWAVVPAGGHPDQQREGEKGYDSKMIT
jgi:hypothetical protein